MFDANGLIKRKKRDKHSTPKSNEMNNQNYFNIPEHAPYYFPINYHQPHSGPTSLPVYSYYSPTISSNKTHSPPILSANETNDYTSLPVGNMDQNGTFSDKRRFSDPGLPCDSDSSTNSVGERVVHKLTQQVHGLKESNRKLHREVADLRMELNLLKQQQSLRHYDRDYEPGMLADIIKEIRDAARVREDALLAKVKHLIEENQFNVNHINMAADKTRSNERISKLEDQLKNLSVNHNSRSEESVSLPLSSIEEHSTSSRQVLELEREALVLRRELQDARAKREESDYKLLQLDKKLATLLRLNKDPVPRSDISEDGKTSLTSSADTFLPTSAPLNNSSGSIYTYPQKITLSGPVTDL